MAPKKQRLKAAEDDLAREMELLQIKRNELQEVTDKLQLLNDDLKEKQQRQHANLMIKLMLYNFNSY